MAENTGKRPHLNNDLAELMSKKLTADDIFAEWEKEEAIIAANNKKSSDDSDNYTELTESVGVEKTVEESKSVVKVLPDDELLPVIEEIIIAPEADNNTEKKDSTESEEVEEKNESAQPDVVEEKNESAEPNVVEDKNKVRDTEVSNESKESSEPKKPFPWKTIAIIFAVLIGVLIIGIAVTYYVYVQKYKTVFFDNTYINGIDASESTPDQVKSIVKDLSKDYEITIKSRYRDDEKISAKDIDLEYVTGDEIDNILSAQKPIEYLLVKNTVKEYEIPAMLSLDDAKLSETCKKLTAFEDSSATAPVNAAIGEYDPNANEYIVIPEINGNAIINKDTAVSYIKDSILNLKDTADLETIGDYIYPFADIRSNNEDLLSEKEALDRYVQTKITYKDSDIVLDGNTIKDWIKVDESKVISIDDDKVKAFVKKVADKLDTVGKERTFKSWYGNDTHVSGGTFGWKVDQEAEYKELMKLIPESGVTEREPVYTSRGIVHGASDWGDTYVEVNLAKQHLFFVKDGKLVVETDVVSGGLQRKAGTPTGVYSVKYKSQNAILRGPRRADGSYEWESPVSYWMPFNGGIGLHDATWRGSFGGNIYRYSGSHGCVNLPKKNAKIIYDNIEVGTPVIVYDDDFEIVKSEEETTKETEKETKKVVKPKPTQAATQAETQATPVTQQSETEGELPVETEAATQGEIGPGVTPNNTGNQVGPAFDTTENSSEDIITNAENMPGDM